MYIRVVEQRRAASGTWLAYSPVHDALEQGHHPRKEGFEDTQVNKPTEERPFVSGGGDGCLRLWL